MKKILLFTALVLTACAAAPIDPPAEWAHTTVMSTPKFRDCLYVPVESFYKGVCGPRGALVQIVNRVIKGNKVVYVGQTYYKPARRGCPGKFLFEADAIQAVACPGDF